MNELAKFDPSKEQIDLIRQTVAPGATPLELQYLLEVAKARNLNPLTKQIYFVKLAGKWTFQVSIDGLRAIAQRSGLYAGQDAPVFEYDDKRNIISCSVAVYRKDWQRPCVGIAFFKEYVGQNLWQTKPHTMIAKVAESIALRKAFSEEMSGLYAPEEFEVAPVVARIVPEEPHVEPAAAEDFAPEDETQEPEVIRVHFGKNQGRPISELTAASLDWYIKAAKENIEAGRFVDKETAWLENLTNEKLRRAS
jgi:phage recombination protein Bet